MKCRRIYEGIIKAYQEPLAVTREPCAGEEAGGGGGGLERDEETEMQLRTWDKSGSKSYQQLTLHIEDSD